MKGTGVLALALALVSIVPSDGGAQEVLIGGQLGPSFFTFRGEGVDGLDRFRTGLAAGVTVAYPLGRLMRLESGVWWVEKGAEGELQGFEEAISADHRLSYLQIPFLVRFSAFPERPIRPSVSVGPTVAFETRCEARMDTSVLATFADCDDVARVGTDLGLLVGAGLSWRIRRVELLIEGLYEFGLRDIDSLDSVRTHNRGFVLTPRLSLPL